MPPASVVNGPAAVSFRPVRPGKVSRVWIPLSVAPGEQVPPATLDVSEAFAIEADRCAGTPPAGSCRVRVRFAPTTAGSYAATLKSGERVVRLTAAAYSVGPVLAASPGGFSWFSGPFAWPPVDSLHRARLINRGDDALT